MPPAPPWWPLAPGWWVLLGLVCVIAITTWLLYRTARKKRRLRERILAEIEQVAVRYPHDDAAYAASLHQLLRRAAWRYATDAHSSQGKRWKEVLLQVPVDMATVDALMTLDARMYQQHADFDRFRVEAAARRWLDAALKHTKTSEVGHA
ncbi:DUF4381 domain-containing protein [Dyella caseinilytica]|uniref:DUF4381 domain-containing protein n=2 Tax=Dyella caseinilytica TaxID=1849581 RepID=A0ABX7GRH7_9GAMM|nr:DUF4381 domain-containing protein [Dyella caseinilytica]